MSGQNNGHDAAQSESIQPRGDTAAAIEFLRKFRPGGPWLLVANSPDFSAHSSARTFSEANASDLAAWIDSKQGKWNVNFALNPIVHPIDRQATFEDVARVEWLHADVDLSQTDREFDEALKSAIDASHCLDASGPPSMVVGYGRSAFLAWRVDGGSDLPAQVKLYNLDMAIAFGARASEYAGLSVLFAANRTARLPGTLLVTPTRSGTSTVPVRLLSLLTSEESKYPISRFKKSVDLQDECGAPLGGGGDVAALPRVQSIDHLKAMASGNGKPLDGYVVDLVTHGYEPDDPKNVVRPLPTQYRTSEAAALAVACALVRSDVADEVITSLLTDARFGISRPALATSRPVKFAARTAKRARQFVESPDLLELNDRHSVISDMGGRCVVITEVQDRGRRLISKQSFQNFRDRYVKRKVKVGEKTVGKDPHATVVPVYENLGDWWLKHPRGNQYDRVVFAPGCEVPGCYNLWQGFAVEPRPGDCSLYLAHVMDNVCCGNAEHYAYLLNWMARAVQKPDEIGYTAIVVRGRQRTGKTFFGQWFGKLFGTHMWHIADADLLVGRFNAHLRDSVLIVADEAFYAGDKKHESKLKMLITQEEVPYEPKGVDTEMGPNYTHLIMSSDKDWVVPVGLDEQRFFILNVSDRRMNQHDYFRAIERQMLDGGLEALLHQLLTRDISEFQVRAVPQTEALVRQKLLSMSPEQEWWYLKLRDGAILPRHDGWVPSVACDELQRDYVAYAEMRRLARPAAPTMLGMFLGDICPGKYPCRVQRSVPSSAAAEPGVKKYRRLWHYEFPPLEDCRSHFERHLGSQYRWPDVDEGDASGPDDGQQVIGASVCAEAEDIPF